jgi:hypothetical protein
MYLLTSSKVAHLMLKLSLSDEAEAYNLIAEAVIEGTQ